MKYLFVYYAAGGLLVPDGIICPVVSVSPLTSFIIYIFVIEISVPNSCNYY